MSGMDQNRKDNEGALPTKLKIILANVLEVDSISVEDSPGTIASWDSLRHLNVVLSLEQEFHVSFDADEIPELNSVRAICAALARRGIPEFSGTSVNFKQ
jgi:acyl carrier protein